jgi:hypothetical protein
MTNAINEKLLVKILSIGAALTTILIVSGSVTDPVNAPKLVIIGVTGVASLALLFSVDFGKRWKTFKFESLLGILFIFFMVTAVVASKSPISQNLYGSYGRNNGFFTYLFLLFIFLASLVLKFKSSFEFIIKSLLFAGLINVVYCLWVIAFGDFIGWSNPYGNILGTLGNPNFIGSFLGIFFTAYLAFALKSNVNKLFQYSLIVVLPITAFEIYKSHAIQGRVVAALGVGILGFLLVRARFGNAVTLGYLSASIVIGVLSLLGALQIGPLAKYIYKTSVSLRGQYWLAGWNTGEAHPLTGVGMDSFGDWYRRSRDAHALELPGVNTVVNAAHNVPMDIFAFGGWPLFITYIAIMSCAAVAALRLVIRSKEFDPIFAVLITGWVGYQVQSIISINQIGLAVWGWILSGSVIAYERATRISTHEEASKVKNKAIPRKSDNQSALFVLIGAFGAVVGLVIALPPMVSDAKWRSAQVASTVQGIESTMVPSFYNLQNTTKYLNNIQSLESSGLFDLSHKYAQQAVKWNPESFELWKVLYLVKNSTSEEKAIALENMKRLDPLNPDVTSTQ